MKRHALLSGALFALLVSQSSCDSVSSSTASASTVTADAYKSENIYAFVASCVSTSRGDTRYCGCMMDVIRRKVPYSQFVHDDVALRLNRPASSSLGDVLVEVQDICRK